MPRGSKGLVGTHPGALLWCNTEPCGLFCGMVTYLLVGFGMNVFTKYVVIPWLGLSVWAWPHLILFNALGVMAVLSHARAMTTDPGAVPKDARPLQSDLEERAYEMEEERVTMGVVTDAAAGNVDTGGSHDSGKSKKKGGRVRLEPRARTPYRKWCRYCRAFKPQRAHHCSICGRCIVKMDHHCPWVNNCIGVANHKLFLLFLFYTNVLCWYALVMCIARFAACLSSSDNCGRGESEADHHDQSHTHSHRRHGRHVDDDDDDEVSAKESFMSLMIILLIVEAVLFGCFTFAMMADQYSVVQTNLTQIDRLKKQYHRGVDGINEVCGGSSATSFLWSWIVPRPVRHPERVLDQVLGFTTREYEYSVVDSDDPEEGRQIEMLQIQQQQQLQQQQQQIQQHQKQQQQARHAHQQQLHSDLESSSDSSFDDMRDSDNDGDDEREEAMAHDHQHHHGDRDLDHDRDRNRTANTDDLDIDAEIAVATGPRGGGVGGLAGLTTVDVPAATSGVRPR